MKTFIGIIITLSVGGLAVPQARASQKKHLKVVKINFSEKETQKARTPAQDAASVEEISAAARQAQRIQVSMDESIPDPAEGARSF